MSRCFPYPPPGYVKNGICDEALIESIKIQREGEKAKKERKKEKKRDKKEKEKARENGEVDNKKHRHKKRHREEKSQEDLKGGDNQKRRKHETDNLEKSSLTEEHGQPVGSQNSSDSTLNSSKRQRPSLSPDSRQNSGSVFRIRLPLQRHKDPEALPIKEQPCSSSGRPVDSSAQRVYEPTPKPGRDPEHVPSTSAEVGQELTPRLSKEACSSSSQASKKSAHKADPPAPPAPPAPPSTSSSVSSSLASQYQNLIENWIPPPIQRDLPESDDLEWLLDSKGSHSHKAERCKVATVALCDQNSTPWPRATYLPEADIYALPFTVPF